MNNLTIRKIAIICFFIMFIYSGINKIPNFVKNTNGLSKKTGFPYPINELGIIGVILLEIIGSLLIIYYFLYGGIDRDIIRNICLLFLLFLIVVTPLYHPPTKNIIPFLSNVTTFGGLLLIFDLI